MPGTPMRLVMPKRGLYESSAFAEQPPETTPDCLNVRSRNPRTNRVQVCQRAGLSKYNTTTLSGANAVREIVSVVKYDDRVTYTTKTAITNADGIRWQAAFPSGLDGIAIVADDQGNTYTCAATSRGSTGINYIQKVNSAGATVWTYAVALAQNTHFLRSIRLDIYGDIYVCLGGSGTDGRIYKYRQLAGDAGLTQIWDIHAPKGGLFADICTSGGVLYAIENDATYSYLHRIDGAYDVDPVLTWTATVARQSADSEVAVACAVAADGGCIVAVCDTASNPTTKNGALRKFGPQKPAILAITNAAWTDATKTLTQTGAFAGAVPSQTLNLTTIPGGGGVTGVYTIATVVSADAVTLTADINGASGNIASGVVGASTYDSPAWVYNAEGVGQAVVVRGSSVYSCGYSGTGAPKYFTKFTDNGTSLTGVWDVGTLEAPGIVPTQYKGTTSMDVDALGVVYATIGDTGASTKVLARIKADGSGVDWLIDAATTTNLAVELFGVACDPNLTDNGTKSECIYVTGTPLATTLYGLHRIDLLTIATVDGSPRTTVLMAACNGNIVKFAAGAGASSTPTGGASALSTTARWTMAVAAFNRVLWTDGMQYRSYNALTDTVSEWKAVGTGAILPRARLLMIHNGAAWTAGFEDQPQNWAKSENGNFDGWDFFPVTTTETQAVIGNNTPAGQCPDIITALISLRDDLAIFGGDHTIYRMTGDPAAGGRFDLVTDMTGIAFGRAWCKDERGALYFFSNQGGVYRMNSVATLTTGIMPERISTAIDQRLKAVNIGSTNIRLVWNDREEGVHVFLTPYAGGATTHYYWSRETESWSPDTMPNAMNPTSVYITDGDDPSDRAILIGGSDGYCRYLNLNATSDDGTAITSYTVIGPIQAGQGEIESIMKNMRAVVDDASNTVDFQTFGADAPNYASIGTYQVQGSWGPGRNAGVWDRTRGQSVWLKVGRFRNPTAGQWAIESVDVHMDGAGIARNR